MAHSLPALDALEALDALDNIRMDAESNKASILDIIKSMTSLDSSHASTILQNIVVRTPGLGPENSPHQNQWQRQTYTSRRCTNHDSDMLGVARQSRQKCQASRRITTV